MIQNRYKVVEKEEEDIDKEPLPLQLGNDL
jgi:hypothetical protein